MSESRAIAAVRKQAAALPEVSVGTVCNKDAYKARNKNFLFLWADDTEYKLKLKLADSLPEAQQLAAAEPDYYSVGSSGWVDIEMPNKKSPPRGVLKRWVLESFRLNAPKKLLAELP